MFQQFVVIVISYAAVLKLFTSFFEKNRETSNWKIIKKRLMGSRILGTFAFVSYVMFLGYIIIMLDRYLNNLLIGAAIGGIILGFTKSFVNELFRK